MVRCVHCLSFILFQEALTQLVRSRDHALLATKSQLLVLRELHVGDLARRSRRNGEGEREEDVSLGEKKGWFTPNVLVFGGAKCTCSPCPPSAPPSPCTTRRLGHNQPSLSVFLLLDCSFLLSFFLRRSVVLWRERERVKIASQATVTAP